MRKLVFIAVILLAYQSVTAQVGIGNVVPDANSILDLTNTNNRGLVLPSAPGSLPSTPNGILFWNTVDNTIVYREANGYNALSPWKYKFGGAVSLNTYYDLAGNVGIGETDPQVKLHITENGRALVLEGTSTSYLSFRPIGFNDDGADIGFVNSSSTLKIENERQGDVEVTMNSNGGVRKFNVTNGTVQQRGADLVPAGTIVMYFSSSPPSGWGLCNGATYTRADGTGSIQAPDLRGRFIVAAGNGYSQGSTGGDDDIQLTSAHLPEHNHTYSGTTTDVGSSHDHRYGIDYDASGNLTIGYWPVDAHDDANIGAEDAGRTANEGEHTHTYSGTTNDTGNSSIPVIDNRPEYYAVTFIMKL